MSLVINLPPSLEADLASEAESAGLTLPEYVLRLLEDNRTRQRPPRTGAELVEYWEREGLIGTRPDIEDVEQHSRSLREKSEARSRP